MLSVGAFLPKKAPRAFAPNSPNPWPVTPIANSVFNKLANSLASLS